MSRKLNDDFKKALAPENGILKELLCWVKKDSTLDLQFRGSYIDIYYRGGRILHLEQSQRQKSEYTASIDPNYLKEENKEQIELPSSIKSENDLKIWLDNFPYIKQKRDFHYSEEKNTAEREFVQMIVRSNNYERTSGSTDFYITDMEYDLAGDGKIDLLGFQVIKNSKDKIDAQFAFIEVKFGNSSVKGESGLVKHLSDIENFVIRDGEYFKNLKKDTQEVFRQKVSLGLTSFDSNVEKEISFEEGTNPLFIIVLADYKRRANNLKNIISEINEMNYPNLNIKFALGSFMGYGMYSDCLYSKSEVLNLLKRDR